MKRFGKDERTTNARPLKFSGTSGGWGKEAPSLTSQTTPKGPGPPVNGGIRSESYSGLSNLHFRALAKRGSVATKMEAILNFMALEKCNPQWAWAACT
mmetsp:Transcript_126656/g.229997  ORF Transcript_126656/g.229997 Transcript_126656/m.229997 type:complete len:98 (-) Transcript_126656:7-300(-)